MKKLTAATEIVDVAAFKRATHMPESEAADDELISALIDAAIAVVEAGTGHPMVEASYQFTLPVGDYCRWWFPVRPLAALSSVQWSADGINWQGVGAGGAYVLSAHDEPCLVIPDELRQSLRGSKGVRVTADVGGEPDSQQNQAVILIAKEWRDAGIALEAVEAHELSWAVSNLIRQVRYRRPQELG